jgi:nucleoside-diphosphate-sugar epimerase
MTTHSTVLLAGASGVFGRHIRSVLEPAGYRVLGLGRGAANEVRADLIDREQLLRAVAGTRADIVVHAATALAKPPALHRDMVATDRLRTTGMRNLVDVAGELGAGRMIGENMVFGYGYGEHGPTPLTETAPFGPRQADRHLEAHVAAMREKERLTLETPGVDGVSLRFGLFYGPGGTDALVPLLRRRRLPAPSSPGHVLPWVDLEDAARAVLAAIEKGRAGEAYTIADAVPMGFGDHLLAVADAYGTPRPVRVPAGLLRPARLLHAMLRTDLRVDTTKARAELGWSPLHPSAVERLADLADAARRSAP